LRLTRRANQAHIYIIAKIIEPAPQERQRVFHFGDDVCKIGFNLPNWFCGIFIKV